MPKSQEANPLLAPQEESPLGARSLSGSPADNGSSSSVNRAVAVTELRGGSVTTLAASLARHFSKCTHTHETGRLTSTLPLL